MRKNRSKADLELALAQAQERIAELEAAASQRDVPFANILFRVSPAQMALTDTATGQYVEVNDAFLRTLGFARAEVIGKTALELKLFAEPAQREELLQRMAVQGYLRDEHVLVRTRSGELRQGTFSAEYIALHGQRLLLTVMEDITARREAEQAQRQSEVQYHSLVESQSHFVIRVNMAGEYSYWNKQFEKEFGWIYAPEKMHHADVLTAVCEHHHQRVQATVKKCMAQPGIVFSVEIDMLAQNGELRTTLWEFVCIADEHSQPAEIQCMGVEITERKKAEQAFREREAQLNTLFESSPVAIAVSRLRDHKLTHANAAFESLTGYSREELLGKTTVELGLWEILADRQPFIDTIQAKGVDTLETIAHSRGGASRNVLISAKSVEINGEPCAMAHVVDITQFKQVETLLRESEAKYRSLIESQDSAISTIDGDGIFHTMNGSGGAPFGGPDFVVGKRLHELFPPPIADWQLAKVRQVIATRQGLVHEYKSQVAGRPSWRRVSIQPIYNADGSVKLATVNSLDITERKLAEEKLRESETRYQQFISLALEAIARTEFDQPIDTALPVETQIDLIYANAYLAECNQAMANMYRMPLAAMVGMRLRDVHGSQDTPINRAAFRRFILGGYQSIDNETIEVAADGQPVWFLSNTIGVVQEGKLVRMWETAMDITERKRAEAALRASEEKYRGLMESLDNVVSTVDRAGRFLYMNDMGAARLGGTPQDFIGKSMQDIFPASLAARQLAGIQQIFQTDQKVTLEAQSLGDVNELRWYRFALQPLHDEQGRVSQVLINATDIHDLKTAQQELLELNHTLEARVQERTAQVQDLYDNAPVGYHSLDAQGRFTAINQTELRWLGYTREELLGKPIASVYTSQSAELFIQLFQKFKETGAIAGQEIETVRKDGAVLPVVINATAIYDQDGHYVSSRSTMTDITARKRVENELKRNINFTSALLDAIPTPVFYKDRTGRYQGCNQAFAAVMGKTAADIRGKTVHELWPSADADLYHQKDLDLMRDRTHQVYEASVRDKDGFSRPVIFVKDIFHDEEGAVAGLVGAFVDITERKNAEDALRLTNLELERAVRVKDEFLASMSHELRTPLNAILGLSESLLEQYIGPLNDYQFRSVQTIESSGRHLLELINDVLDLSKLEAGRVELELTTVLVQEVVANSLVFIKEMARRKQIQVESKLDPTVAHVQADERRLKQMLVNLLSNAVKFTPDGGRIELRVTGNREDQTVRFAVTDSGIGIAAADIQRLFQPFVQLDGGLNRQFEGTGLGLSLVARMARLHGGAVAVTSELGQGSCFTITLPWQSPAPAAAPPATAQVPAPSLSPQFAGDAAPLILVAEDNEANEITLVTYFEPRGYRLASARNGQEVLELARRHRPDLILMDLQMPVMDGLEATRRLRQDSDPQVAGIPVIALTALAMPDDRTRALEAGANEYLSKPVNLKQLTELMNRLLRED